MPITLWRLKIQEINWKCETFYFKPFRNNGKWYVYTRVMDRPFGYLMLDLHPSSSDNRRIVSHLLKDEGYVRVYQLE